MKTLAYISAACVLLIAACSSNSNNVQTAESSAIEDELVASTTLEQTVMSDTVTQPTSSTTTSEPVITTTTSEPAISQIAEEFVTSLIENEYVPSEFDSIVGENADIENIPLDVLSEVYKVFSFSLDETESCEEDSFLQSSEMSELDRECLEHWSGLCEITSNLTPKLLDNESIAPNFVSFWQKFERVACYGRSLTEYADFMVTIEGSCETGQEAECPEVLYNLCSETSKILDVSVQLAEDGLAEIPESDIAELRASKRLICDIAEAIP